MAYSVKPGRGPSLMGGIGGLLVAGFGVIWMIGAARMGAPGFFVAFGVVFILFALAGASYNFFNAGSRERMSSFDITTPGEEGDPIARTLGYEKTPPPRNRRSPQPFPPRENASENKRRIPGEFCPFCGEKVQDDFDYCPKCGKDI